MHTHSEMRAHALELLLTSNEGLCPGSIFMFKATRGSCPGLVPHAYKMSKMNKMIELHSQVELHCRVKLFKMFMMMIYDVNYDAK